MPAPTQIASPSKRYDALYARYSSQKQDDGTSIEVQVEQCVRHPDIDAEVLHYVDKARTGRALGRRHEFKRLRADIAAGRIKRLFVYMYDRLGRSTRLHQVVEEIEDSACEVISCTEGRDTLVRGIQLVLAKEYSDRLARRTRDGLCKRFEQGTHIGGVVRYGYQTVRGDDGRSRVAIHPVEVEVVRKLFAMYLAEPIGFKSLARRLDEMGVPTREGGLWSHMTVRAILQNRWLVGEVKYKERRMVLNDDTGNRLPRRREASEHLNRKNESLQVISEVDFEAVQKLIKARSRPRGAAQAINGVRPFTGHLFCQKCGSVCYSRKSENAKGTYHYYNCGCRQRKGPQACPESGKVREDQLVDHVAGICTDILADAGGAVAGAMKIGLKHMDAGRAEVARLKRDIDDLDAQNRSLMALMRNPAIDTGALGAFSRQIAEKEAERQRIERQIVQVGNAASQSQERLERAVKLAYCQAHEHVSKITSSAHLNRFVEEHLGPMVLTGDGKVLPKCLENTAASALAEAAVNGLVAGGGFEPPTSGL